MKRFLLRLGGHLLLWLGRAPKAPPATPVPGRPTTITERPAITPQFGGPLQLVFIKRPTPGCACPNCTAARLEAN